MRTSDTSRPSLGPIKRASRQAVASPAAMVKTGFLGPGQRFPFVVEPDAEGLGAAEWAAAARDRVEGWLSEHRAVLFRGFPIADVAAFQSFVAASSTGEPLQYRDRSTPRHEVGSGIYVSTIYPQDQRIRLHNEGTYWRQWALKIYFCCLRAPEQGGATPIADVRRVLSRLDPAVRERFAERRVMYVRNYNDGFGLPWQEVFQTADRGEVESYCRANGIELEWKDGDRLRTRQVRPAIRRHPRTGEEVWFNHAAFFHISSQDPEMRSTLLAELGEDNLPYNTYYGDGSAIEEEVVAQIHRAYEAETVRFPWLEGDILLLDNMSVAHGREPYRGEREVVVAMTEPVADSDV